MNATEETEVLAMHSVWRLDEREFDNPYSVSCSSRLLDRMKRWHPTGVRVNINPLPNRFNERDHRLLPILIHPTIILSATDRGIEASRNPSWTHARWEAVVWQDRNGNAFWTAVNLVGTKP